MADITSNTWSEADSDNTQPSPNGLPPGILPSELGASVRAVMGAVKRSHSRSNVMVTSTGTGNAYAISYSVGPAAYVKGEVYRFFAHVTNTGAATLNINALGTRALLRTDGSAVASGEIVAGQVVSVVFDGVNFLAQSVVSKDFKSNVSIAKENDAILTIEDIGAANTSFRRKQIFSTKNDGASGNNWLFRQTRPSDGAIEDFYLKGGTGGTIWTTGNFNPALKADLAGSVFTGTVTVKGAPGIGQSALVAGSADRSGYVEFRDKDGARHGYIGWGTGSTIDIASEKGDYNFVNGTPKIGGNPIWHTGNFTPSLKADLNSTVRFSGVLLGTGNGNIYSDPNAHNVVLRSGDGSGTPYKYAALQTDAFRTYSADILADGNLRTTADVIVGEGKNASTIQMRDGDEGTRYVHNNSNRIGFLGKGGDWVMQVADDGTIWTKQFGDLNTRIENRAYAHGDERGAAWARQEAGARVAKTGDTMTGDLTINKAYPNINYLYPGVRQWQSQVRENGWMYFYDQSGNAFNIAFNLDGGIWTRQFGDLNTRIEDRANAWSASRRDEANNNTAANYFNKTTATAQQINNLPSFNANAIDIVRGGVRRERLEVGPDGYLRFKNGDTDAQSHAFGPGGDIWSAQFGDLYNHVENRASAFANSAANARIHRNGDTMSGNLTISKANPGISLLYGGVWHGLLWVGNDGVFRYSNGDGGGDKFRVGTGGDLWCAQLGDIATRIEDRAYAWAQTRQAPIGFNPVEQSGGPYQGSNKVRLGWDGGALRVSVDGGDHEKILHRSWVNPVIDIRLAYAGDLDNSWNKDQSYAEPYGGGVLTSRYVVSNQFIVDSWKGGRWRYLQKQDSYGNWYTVGYV